MSTFDDFMIGQAVKSDRELDELRAKNRKLNGLLDRIAVSAQHALSADSPIARKQAVQGLIDILAER